MRLSICAVKASINDINITENMTCTTGESGNVDKPENKIIYN